MITENDELMRRLTLMLKERNGLYDELRESKSIIKELNERILGLERDLDNAIANGEDYKRNYPSNWDGEY